jgi:hypothetical protein
MTRKMVVDSVTTKTMAAIQGMFLGKERGAKGIILEGDANQIVMVVNSSQPCNSIYGHLIEDIQEGMVDFKESSFIFTPKGWQFCST